MTRLKSRYCVECEALYQWQCKCPNNKKHKNIMKKFHKIKIIGSTPAPAKVGKTGGEELLKLLGNDYKKKI